MTWIEVRRIPNNHLLARFHSYTDYRYRLTDGSEIPLRVQYAWCARCENFVEAEDTYSEKEINERIERCAAGSHTQKAWQAALNWNGYLQSPARCLSCGSCSAIKPLRLNEKIRHPIDGGAIVVAGDGTLGGSPFAPAPMFFDHQGLRIVTSNTE